MAQSKTILAATLALFLLLATTLQRTDAGLLLSNLDLITINVGGIVYCSTSGNPEQSCATRVCPRLSGIPISVSCDGGRTPLAQAVTNINGEFAVVLGVVEALVFDVLSCGVYVNLPVAHCAVLPPTGILEGAFQLVSIVPTLLGNVANFKALPFQLLGAL